MLNKNASELHIKEANFWSKLSGEETHPGRMRAELLVSPWTNDWVQEKKKEIVDKLDL